MAKFRTNSQDYYTKIPFCLRYKIPKVLDQIDPVLTIADYFIVGSYLFLRPVQPTDLDILIVVDGEQVEDFEALAGKVRVGFYQKRLQNGGIDFLLVRRELLTPEVDSLPRYNLRTHTLENAVEGEPVDADTIHKIVTVIESNPDMYPLYRK